MIQIDRHIEILLLDNDCVIVPGLGGFMAHHVCARYYPDTQTYLPPLRQLGFNAQLRINDSLLAQSYIEAYDISYPEALRRIEEEVVELKQMLHNQGYCELNDIGILRLNIDGNIEFEPCEAGILTPELYGLNSVDVTCLSTKKPAGSVGETAGQKETAVTTPLDMFKEAPKPEPVLAATAARSAQDSADEHKQHEENTPRTISIRISTLKHVGAVAAAIVVLLMCAVPFGKMTQPELTESYIDTGVLYNILPKELCSPTTDTTMRTINYRKATPINTVETVAEKPAEVQQPEPEKVVEEKKAEPTKFYSIVLASRVARPNAEDFVTRLSKSGYSKAEVIDRPNGGVKVIYGRFATETEARNNLNSLRDAAEAFAEAWVMEFNQ